jgi:hypothetical protein
VDLGLEADELDMKSRGATVRRTLAFALALAASVACTAGAYASGELVKNGLLTEGRDAKPDHWRYEAYTEGPAATQATWNVDQSGIGVLSLSSTQPNDARWVQSVPVSPSTWYQVTGWVRAENVGAQTMGAYLAVMDTFHNSRDVRGTTGWMPVGFWIKTGGLETSLKVACRLGGYSSLNIGLAQCTGISVVAAGAPRAGDPFVYGGTPGEDASSGLPIARGVAVLVAIGIGLLVWRYLAPPAARIPP